MMQDSGNGDFMRTKAGRLAALNERRRNRRRGQRSPRVLVLVGIPGSGKSTFANILRESERFEVICQDDLGDRRKCEERITQYLLNDRNVVVDRCNFDDSQRKHWVEYAKACGAELGVIVFGVSFDVCIDRVRNRYGHPTLRPAGESDHVVMRMAKSFIFPTQDEGFGFCRVVRDDSDIARILPELARWIGVQNFAQGTSSRP